MAHGHPVTKRSGESRPLFIVRAPGAALAVFPLWKSSLPLVCYDTVLRLVPPPGSVFPFFLVFLGFFFLAFSLPPDLGSPLSQLSIANFKVASHILYEANS